MFGADPIAIKNEIIEKEATINMLKFLKKALLEGKIEDEEIIENLGVTLGEIKKIKEVLGTKDFLSSSSIYKIDAKTIEIESEIDALKEKLFTGMKLYIFYNWRKGLKARWPGLYKGKNIKAISNNVVIFLSSKEVEWRDIAQRDCRTLLGTGIYSIEFIPEDLNETIKYTLEIHGIHLTKKVLDEMQASPPRIKGRYEDMHRELISIIPLNKLIGDRPLRNYLKNILISALLKDRELFNSLLLSLRNNAKKSLKENDLLMLSSLPEFYNKILVTSKKYEQILSKGEASLSAPGLGGYEPKLDTLNDFLNVISLEQIVEFIKVPARMVTNHAWDMLLSFLG